jgi:hypothetical protein
MAATFAAIAPERKAKNGLTGKSTFGFARRQRTNPMREFFRSIKPQPQDAFAAISLALFWMALFAIAERIIQ